MLEISSISLCYQSILLTFKQIKPVFSKAKSVKKYTKRPSLHNLYNTLEKYFLSFVFHYIFPHHQKGHLYYSVYNSNSIVTNSSPNLG